MSGPIYHLARRDKNEPAIRDVVEGEFKGSFQPISVKDGPDAIVGYAGKTEVWEIKDGSKRLRPGQVRWAVRWRGGPVATVRNEAQARKRLRMMAAPLDAPVNGWDAHERAERVQAETGGKDPEQPA